MNPFDLPGPQFLAFYAVLFVAALVVASILRRSLRQPDASGAYETADLTGLDIAYLAGGRPLATQAALASLVQRGNLTVSADGKKVTVAQPLVGDVPPLERELYTRAGAEQDI